MEVVGKNIFPDVPPPIKQKAKDWEWVTVFVKLQLGFSIWYPLISKVTMRGIRHSNSKHGPLTAPCSWVNLHHDTYSFQSWFLASSLSLNKPAPWHTQLPIMVLGQPLAFKQAWAVTHMTSKQGPWIAPWSWASQYYDMQDFLAWSLTSSLPLSKPVPWHTWLVLRACSSFHRQSLIGRVCCCPLALTSSQK